MGGVLHNVTGLFGFAVFGPPALLKRRIDSHILTHPHTSSHISPGRPVPPPTFQSITCPHFYPPPRPLLPQPPHPLTSTNALVPPPFTMDTRVQSVGRHPLTLYHPHPLATDLWTYQCNLAPVGRHPLALRPPCVSRWTHQCNPGPVGRQSVQYTACTW